LGRGIVAAEAVRVKIDVARYAARRLTPTFPTVHLAGGLAALAIIRWS
jgi:hypothetical protein